MFEIVIALAVVAAVVIFTVWANRPTKTDTAVYDLGYSDGADGREPEQFEHPWNTRIYREAYEDGSRGRTRRADAETLRKRQDGTK